MDWSTLAEVTTTLFAVTAPLAVLPLSIGLTQGMTPQDQRETANIGTITYVVIAFGSFLLGNAILKIFAISVSTITLAGMFLILTIGWTMANAPTPTTDEGTASAADSEPKMVQTPAAIGIVPIGFPMFGGPGVISVMIAYTAGDAVRWAMVAVAILINALILIVLMYAADWIAARVGHLALFVTTKIFGLIVMAIAIGGIVGALDDVFPGLAG